LARVSNFLPAADEKINSFADAMGDSVPCKQVTCSAAPGCVVNDRLVLHELSGQLQLEWYARAVHPWDRDLPPWRQVEAYFEQALADTDLAIRRIFQRLLEIDVIEIRVLDTQDPTKIMLVGVITRENALDADLPYSPKMRLKMMVVQYAKIMGPCLEFVPPSLTPIFVPAVATREFAQGCAGRRPLHGSSVP
jgi:hypothetical protein